MRRGAAGIGSRLVLHGIMYRLPDAAVLRRGPPAWLALHAEAVRDTQVARGTSGAYLEFAGRPRPREWRGTSCELAEHSKSELKSVYEGV